MSPRHRIRTRHGFTLVELLVVIGIIALLISILLPSLQSARRQANSVKCLSSLRQIGNAFMLYGNEFKGAWPPAIHAINVQPVGFPTERRWYDQIAKYISGNTSMAKETDIAKIRANSVIWGCPEWRGATEYDPNNYADTVRPGYGMQYYPSYFTDGHKAKNLAYISSATTGSYVKANVWQRHGSERGLIADAVTHIIGLSNQDFSFKNTAFQPYNSISYPTYYIFIDGARHLKPGTSKVEANKRKGLNMLFCDGHASPVTPAEAQNAIRCPGQVRVIP